MYDRRGSSGLGRVLLIVIATLCIGVIWLGASGGGPTRTSAWGSQGAVAPASGLSGITQPMQRGRGLPGDPRPYGNPLQVSGTVMTQGYGVGTHAPAEIWGAVDLAIDGNGDGVADPEGTRDKPVYATHSGIIKTTPNSKPAGNHIWVTNDEYRTGYAHLARFAVSDDQVVTRGDLIGFIGSTGNASGPHLDYQVWVMQGGRWVNANPLDYGALDVAP
ncbi:MAG: M23 family metallopeptidase [Chloroflexales bacterium]|nr:M23 family metallopeptidase [Chloroflexales bacterium]